MNDLIILSDGSVPPEEAKFYKTLTLTEPVTIAPGVTIPAGTKLSGRLEYRFPALNNSPTELNKKTLFDDDAAALYGFSGDAATPCEALKETATRIGEMKLLGYRSTNTRYVLCDGTTHHTGGAPELFKAIGYNYCNMFFAVHGNPSRSRMNAVCWSPERELFVAAGYDINSNSYNSIYTSSNGTTWTPRYVGGVNSVLYSVCWSPELGLFVAAGGGNNQRGIINTSYDGITWKLEYTTNVGATFLSVCWSPEKAMFVAVGGGPTAYDIFYSSPDGITWTAQQTNSVGARMNAVCWSPERDIFVAVGEGVFCTSPDGVVWTVQQTIPNAPALRSVCWSPELGLFAAAVYTSNPSNLICYTSPDGVTWTDRYAATARADMLSVCWSPEEALFVAVGSDGSSPVTECYTSPDGITWTSRQKEPESAQMTAVCWSPAMKIFAAVGANNNNYALFFSAGRYFKVPDYSSTPYMHIRVR